MSFCVLIGRSDPRMERIGGADQDPEISFLPTIKQSRLFSSIPKKAFLLV